MGATELVAAVGRLADVALNMTDADLNQPWAWQSYDSEGVRFAFFRALEELRRLEVELAMLRIAHQRPRSAAQRILSQYHAAYLDLEVNLIDLSDEQANRAPAENEWSIRETVAHIIEADAGFYAVLRYALERHRTNDGRPAKVPVTYYDQLLGSEESFHAQARQPLSALRSWHAEFHAWVLRDFVDMSDDELELPASYWEAEPYSLRFRLHRFESHLRQHTIQVEKCRAALGYGPTEINRLLRMLSGALASVEAYLIGDEGLGDERLNQTATAIHSLASEIELATQR
jgi:uncharacterized damage-inducible protein DinB